MRFFIALSIPEKNRIELKHVQNEIKQIIPHLKMTDPDKLHLTIAFIGDQPDQFQYGLTETLKQAVVGIPEFEVTPGYIDGFPTLHNPHVLWIGVKDEVDKLFILRERIKDSLVNLDQPVDERRYIPHIAFAKVAHLQLSPLQERQFEEIMSRPFSPLIISEIKLFESIPNHGFHQHNTLATIPLERS